jgi:hypothetical protein
MPKPLHVGPDVHDATLVTIFDDSLKSLHRNQALKIMTDFHARVERLLNAQAHLTFSLWGNGPAMVLTLKVDRVLSDGQPEDITRMVILVYRFFPEASIHWSAGDLPDECRIVFLTSVDANNRTEELRTAILNALEGLPFGGVHVRYQKTQVGSPVGMKNCSHVTVILERPVNMVMGKQVQKAIREVYPDAHVYTPQGWFQQSQAMPESSSLEDQS